MREDLGTPESYNQEGSLRDAVEALPPGHIVVVDARESTDCATLGDIMVARIQARGGLGVVCDGPLRDVSAVKALSFPVYCTGASAPPSIAGLVLVPRGLAAEVAAAGVEQERFERYVQKRIEQGAPVKGLYPPDDETLRAYEAWRETQQD